MGGLDADLAADDAALEARLRDHRFGPPDPGDVTPWDFALRLPDATVRERVWPIVSRLLLDDDVTVRARAVELVRGWRDGAALTLPRLLEVAEHHADQFGDQPCEGASLRHELAFALCDRVDASHGERIAALLRAMAMHEPVGGGAASVLGRYAPMFVAERAQTWGDAQAAWIVEAASSLALCRRDSVMPFLAALTGLATTTRERIVAAIEAHLQRDDGTASELARTLGQAPPIEPAPSVADCRRAIGLEPPARSSSLERLLHEIANPSDVAWNEETYDLAIARGLSAAERAAYVATLLANAGQGDTHAILTLGNLPAAEAVPVLRVAATSQDPWAQTARRALVLLGHGAEVVAEIANDAVHGPAKMGRVAAVLDLPKIGGAIAIAALEQALADADDTVRGLAWNGLVTALDLDRHIRNPEGKRDLSTEIELLSVLLTSELAAFVTMGRDGMRQLVAQLRAGATPRALGIVWAPTSAPELFVTLRVALFTADATLPVDDLAALTGVERRWAEAMIALRLEQPDARIGAALVQLGAAWTAPALDEVASSPATPPELREQLAQCARVLRAA